jgi:hypothetical protein
VTASCALRRICWYFCGMADQEELLAHLAKLHKPSEPRKRII